MLQLRSYGASFIATRGREREGVPLPVAVFHMKIPLEIGNGVLVVALPTATYPRVSPFGDVHQLRLRPNAAS
jgi:hypothetical protein